MAALRSIRWTCLLVAPALVVAACTGGGAPPEGTSPASTAAAGAPGPGGTTGVWLGGDPVQWARDECLAMYGVEVTDEPPTTVPAVAAEACRDFTASGTWRTALLDCLRSNGSRPDRPRAPTRSTW